MAFQERYLKKHNLEKHKLTEKQRNKMDESCFNRWTKVLLKMEEDFRIAAGEDKFWSKILNDCGGNEKEAYEAIDKAKKRALKAFVKYFDNLWW